MAEELDAVIFVWTPAVAVQRRRMMRVVMPPLLPPRCEMRFAVQSGNATSAETLKLESGEGVMKSDCCLA